MSKIVNTNIRFNLEREADRSAWEHLQQMDRAQYKSYSRAVISAVNDYFHRRGLLNADPFLETREKEEAFLQTIRDTIRQELQTAASAFGLLQLLQGAQPAAPAPAIPPEQEETLDAAMDFLDSF